MRHPLSTRSAAFLTLATAVVATLAAPLAAQAAGIDPNTFRPGHPASPTWQRPAHAGAEHPAVQVQRAQALPHVAYDSNHFAVQPPASVRWVLRSGDAADMTAAAALPPSPPSPTAAAALLTVAAAR